MRLETRTGASSFSRALALLVAGTYFMEILDGTIIATAAPAIAADLQVRPVDINLAMTAYLITLAVGIPISGWLAERFGARKVFTAAIAVFTVASLLCALSPNLAVLCVARMLQGLGGAMMVPVGRLVVLRDADRKEFLEAIAYLTWPALIAPVLAPVLGGLIVSYASWHWIFLINVPLGVVAFIVALKVVPDIRARKVPPPDWVGFLLCGTALAALVIGMELVGSAPTPWAAVVLWLLLFVACTGAALWWFKRALHPLLDLRALRIHTFRVGNGGGAVYRLVINAVPFLLPLMFMLGFGWGAFEAGLMTMAVFAGNVLIKPATSPVDPALGISQGAAAEQSGRGAGAGGLRLPDSGYAAAGHCRGAVCQRRAALHRLQRLQHAAVCGRAQGPHGRRQHPVINHRPDRHGPGRCRGCPVAARRPIPAGPGCAAGRRATR